MPYSITTRDGITINNIPDNVAPDSEELKSRVATIRATSATAEPAAPPVPVPVDATLGDNIVGVGETALTLATGATGGALGMIGGTLKGLAEQILSGQFGTQEAVQMIQKSAQDAASALTFAPRTERGQEMAQATGEFLGNALPVLPILGPQGALLQSAAQSVPVVRNAAQQGAALVGQGVRATGQAAATAGRAVARPVQGAINTGRAALGIPPAVIPAAADDAAAIGRASIGAAGLNIERQRLAELNMANDGVNGVPIRMTEGEFKRDPTLLAFEKETAKTPGVQELFVQRQQQNNRATLGKINQILDDTGAVTGDYSNTGIAVVDALMKGWAGEKAKTKVLYDKFRDSTEAGTIVDPTPVLEFLNTQARGVAGITGVPDTARQNAVRLGIAREQGGGDLVPIAGVTLGQLEDFRQSVSRISAANPNDKRLSSIIKRSIDDIGDPIGGGLTKAMRAQRRNQAAKYEDRAIVSRLLLEKKGMADPKTPIEDVFRASILNSRTSDITRLKRVLNTIPDEEGKQAFKELQGATVRHLLEKSESGFGTDNLPTISSAKLDRAIKAFDQNGKLDTVMGVGAAEQIRNLNQVLKYIQSTPPLTSINNSGTARTIAALISESAVQGMVTGIPLPIVQSMRMIRQNIADKKTKDRITQALNYTPDSGDGAP
jgi:hypothetical protein